VKPGRDQTLGFAVGGKIQDVLPPGTTFQAGETVARLQGSAAREAIVNQIRSRIAYYEQMLESSRAQGSQAAADQAQLRLDLKRKALDEAQTELARVQIRPANAGVIGEVLADSGALVRAGAPVLRLRASGPRAVFRFAPSDAVEAAALSFCRVESIPGTAGGDGGTADAAARALDCTLPPPGSGAADGSLGVDLAGAALPPGTQVRLARARYDAVFPLPRSAVTRPVGDGDAGAGRIWIVSASGTATERNDIQIAGDVGDLSLIARGLQVGDAVIVDPPEGLRDGQDVRVAQ